MSAVVLQYEWREQWLLHQEGRYAAGPADLFVLGYHQIIDKHYENFIGMKSRMILNLLHCQQVDESGRICVDYDHGSLMRFGVQC
jgi:hypothetical protein